MKISSIASLNYNSPIKSFAFKQSIYSTHLYQKDDVSFTSSNKNKELKPLNLEFETSQKLVKSLATSTSGHRAPYMSETFTPEAINLITLGFAQYAKKHSLANGKPTVIIGGDTRTATRKSLPQIKDTLIKQGINVLYIKDPIPTPLLAMLAEQTKTGISILMTASHNPWSDGGFNFITSKGAIASSDVTHEIGKNMDIIARQGSYYEEKIPSGKVFEINPYNLYKNRIEKLGIIDFDKIKSSGIKVYYDGLQGTGIYVMPKLLKDYGINCEEIVSSGQIGPNPTSENLKELRQKVSFSKDEFKIGLANDGDADRFGIIDENGNFIDPNDVLLLVAYHLINNRNLKGNIVKSQATSQQLERLAQKYNLKTFTTPVGFKYLASDIIKSRKEGGDIIVAGEESGGLTAYGHIPEKDGILADFLILDLMAKENKPIGKILQEVKQNLDIALYSDNYSKRTKDNETKEKILAKVEKRFNQALDGDVDFGKIHKVDIEKTYSANENIKKYRPQGDGYKFVMTDGSTVLVRKSGTEPLLRFYIEATGENEKAAYDNSQALKEYLEENFKE